MFGGFEAGKSRLESGEGIRGGVLGLGEKDEAEMCASPVLVSDGVDELAEQSKYMSRRCAATAEGPHDLWVRRSRQDPFLISPLTSNRAPH